ncbi:hypothetical protein N0V82_007418 [Gnomoniopsis sp. IMI 355080]|nr:hypothetical protein N0V82_007418 [Gnomoniopsis sp. IMI 355080]
MKLSFHIQRKKSSQDNRERSSSQPRIQPQSIQIQPAEPIPPPDEQDDEGERQASISAANDFIHDLIASEDRWSSHMPLIRINCSHTLSELHALGHLPQPEGVAACRKLIRVPVIHEEISLFIWTQLATIARGSTSTDDPLSKIEKSTDIQLNEGSFLAQLDERFRFDKPASASTRGRVGESPPMSPREELQQLNFSCRPESIDEVDEGLEDSQSKVTAATRGRVVDRSGKSQPPARPGSVRQRSFFSSNGSTGSLAGRLGSVVGEIGQRVAGALGDGLPQNLPRSRSGSAKSL